MARLNRTDAEKFVSTLFDPEDLVEQRWLGERRVQNWMQAKLMRGSALDPVENSGLNIYVGVNPRSRKGGKSGDVALARCVFVDWDGIDATEAMRRIESAGLPSPTLLAGSGHGVHGYWRLAEPMTDFRLWTALQKNLIERVNSDKSIHDPPRIMRWIGFPNVKDEPVDTSIAFADATRLYTLGQLGLDAVVVEAEAPRLPAAVPVAAAGVPAEKGKLRNKTLEILAIGTRKGDRNIRLYQAACELLGAGYDREDVRRRVVEAAGKCQPPVDDNELAGIIASAESKHRDPWISDEEADENFGAWGKDIVPPDPAASSSPKKKIGASPSPRRIVIENVNLIGSGDDRKVVYKPIERILLELQEATGGWPRRVSGLPIVPGMDSDRTEALPGNSAIRYLATADELFAWMHEACEVHWVSSSRKGVVDRGDKTSRTTPTKPEFFQFVKQAATPDYLSAEFLPHHPIVPMAYYVESNLPAANGDALREFAERFNAEEDVDRLLMLAALITPGWGGPCGARPAFLFTSEHGRGVGKSQTAMRFAQVWGGFISVSPETSDWGKARQSLVADSSLGCRVVLVDNVRKRISGSDLESMLTSPIIDGHRLYHGHFQRPNRITWYITANTPRLSQDLADRSVIIKIGSHKYAGDWSAWVERFLADHRPQLLADIMDAMRQEPRCKIEPDNRDRWGTWQDAILSLFLEGNKMAAAIKARRPDVDDDATDAMNIIEELEREFAERGHLPTCQKIRITSQDMIEILHRRGVCDQKMGRRGITGWVMDLASSGPLRGVLGYHRTTKSRGWMWVGPDFDGTGDPVDLFSRRSDQK